MKSTTRPLGLLVLTVLFLAAGCMAPVTEMPRTTPAADSLRLSRALALYETGKYADAVIECAELARQHPDLPGLTELQLKAEQALTEKRIVEALRREELSKTKMTVETYEQALLPDTYGLERRVQGEEGSHQRPPTPMESLLETPVTIHLKGADLAGLIEVLAQDDRLNIVADEGLGAGKKLNVEVDAVPLREVLNYIERNYGVRFYVGENLIWAALPATDEAEPLETRVYQLREGIQFHGTDWPDAPKEPQPRDKSSLTYQSTVLASGKSYLEALVERFVPAVPGAQIHLDGNTHKLFVRNTRENLRLIEEIVDSVDMAPPQVLIEARFVEINVADMRELGIDWVLNSPLPVTRETVIRNGSLQRVPRTRVDSGASVSYTPYRSDQSGAFPLGPQGDFGLLRDGNPPTADQGLNLTYQGILTQPMFSAVLHALEISGRGRTLSVPRVTTVNNNPAKLRHGEDLRFYEEFQAQAFNLVDDNNRRYTVTVLIPSGKPSLEELGITLVAVPSVGASQKTVSLMLTPTISRLEGFVSYQNDSTTNSSPDRIRQVVVKLPIISRREIQTKVLVESGETVVMGGLIDTVQQETEHKIPFLGSIPLVGGLFSRVDVSEQKRNLIIFVTATVISDRGESLLPALDVSAAPVGLPAMEAAPPTE